MVDDIGGLIERPRHWQRLEALIDVPVIKVLTGVRRCGKSSLLSQVAHWCRENRPDAVVVHLNLESTAGLTIRSPEDLLAALTAASPDRSVRTYLLLDEVQVVPGWERVVNAIHSEWDVDIHLTGSNSHMLSGELATLIAGRYVEVPVQTFSFEEFMRSRGLDTSDPSDRANAWKDYLDVGGFPTLRHFVDSREEALAYIRSVYDSALVRDVIEHHQIRDIDIFHRIVRFCLANVARPFSAASVRRFLKSEGRAVSVDTVLNYLTFCAEAFLIERVGRWDLTSKRLLAVDEKWFLADHGLRAAAGFSPTRDIDCVLENIVLRELRQRGWQVSVGRVGEREVDFVAERNGTIHYYQVSYLLADEAVVTREFGALAAIPDQYPKTVLSLDTLDFSRDGIEHVNLVDWLLDTAEDEGEHSPIR